MRSIYGMRFSFSLGYHCTSITNNTCIRNTQHYIFTMQAYPYTLIVHRSKEVTVNLTGSRMNKMSVTQNSFHPRSPGFFLHGHLSRFLLNNKCSSEQQATNQVACSSDLWYLWWFWGSMIPKLIKFVNRLAYGNYIYLSFVFM